MSACPARTEMERLLCTLLPAEGTIASWRSCFKWVQRSSRITGEGPHFMMLRRMESWRLDTTFLFSLLLLLSCQNKLNCIHKTIYFTCCCFLINHIPSLSAVESCWPIRRTLQTKISMDSHQQTWRSTMDTMNVPDISVPWRRM